MSDMSSMSRESKKRQLRQRVISGDQAYGQTASGDGEEAARKAARAARRRRLTILGVVLLLAAAGVTGFYFYRRNFQYTSYEAVWETPINEGSLVGYVSFGSNVLKYTRDGASYTDNRGRSVWTESYEMKSPVAAVSGDYVAIADQQGNSIYICNTDGKQGEATTVLPISRVAVSENGVVAVALEDSEASYITFFRKDGSALDITVKTKMGGDGYPLDMSLSGDGTQLMCSYAYLQGGELLSRVVFYDFSEVGKNVPNRLVGGFDEPFAGTLVPRVTYLAEPYSCAFGGNGPVFFSSKNLAQPSLIAQISMPDEEIQSIFHSRDYVGIIVRNSNSEYECRMEIYQADGTHVLTKEFTYEYTDADIEDDLIILHNEDSCVVYNMAGVQKFSGTFDFPVSRIRQGRLPDRLLVTGPQVMKEIRLK